MLKYLEIPDGETKNTEFQIKQNKTKPYFDAGVTQG